MTSNVSRKGWADTQLGMGILGAVAMAATWEVIPRLFGVNPAVFPPFSTVASAVIENWSVMWDELAFTALETVLSWGLAVVIAGVLACLMELSTATERFLLYPLLAVQNVPKVAITPLIVIWLGHGIRPVLALGVLVAFFPVFLGFRTGLRRDRTGMRSVFGPLCRGRAEMLLKISLPEAMPNILDGCRVGMTLATVGVLVGEIALPERGLGKLIAASNEIFQYDMQFGAILAVCILGVMLYGLVILIEKHPFVARYRNSSLSVATDRAA